MPYKKKFAARRIQRAWRRKKGRHKRYRTPSRATGYLKCIQKFSRTEPIASSGAGSFTTAQEVYSLDQVSTQNLTAFTRLFKFWKISKVVHCFIPRYIGDQGAPAGEPQPQLLIGGNFMSSITLDSNQLQPTTAAWTNIDQAEESGNLKKRYLCPQTGNRAAAYVSLIPRTNNWIRTDAASLNSTVALGKKGWISTGTPGTQMYGLRWAYELLQPHPGFTMEVRTKMYFEFKGVN